VIRAPQLGVDISNLEHSELQQQVNAFEAVLKNRIEEDPENILRITQLFQTVHPYLHRKLGLHRLIAKIDLHEGQRYLVLLRVFHRTDSDYREKVIHAPENNKNFLEDSVDYPEMLRSENVNNDLTTIPMDVLLGETHPSSAPISRSWYEVLPDIALDPTDVTIYETQAWISAVESREFRAALASLKDVLIQASQRFASYEQGSVQQFRDPSTGYFVAITFFPNELSLFLHEPRVEQYTDDELRELRDRFGIRFETARRGARRAYPYWILADFSIWQSIEDGGKSNLALSPEELEILRAVGNDPNSLPLIVDGRAGSGKSTMLNFIFASLLLRQREASKEEVPVYISYNDRLLEAARRTIMGIYRSNSQVATRQIKDGQHKDTNPGVFLSFREYLLEHLSGDEREMFPDSNYISFSDFKNSYKRLSSRLKLPSPQLQLPQRISAEFAWFGIRQFIKGLLLPDGTDAVEDLSDLQETYDSLSSKARTISFEDLQTIFQEIYLPWYKVQLKENNLWDDQDLVRQALTALGRSSLATHSSRIPGRVTAIVCDEVQDFSQQDLQFVLNSSHLLRAGKPLQEQYRTPAFPLIFAGDPMQTLSPSGFRWARLKTQIWETLRALDSARQIAVRSLRYNYRSKGDIVRLANSIQVLRKTSDSDNLDDSSDYEPALLWNDEMRSADAGFSEIDKFIVSPDTSEAQFAELGDFLKNDVAIMVPCEGGEEGRYVRENAVLNGVFPIAPDGLATDSPQLIFSAHLAKGLEFDNVVLFYFGEELAKIHGEARTPQAKHFAEKFLLNKLYVSATRAVKNLIVVDTPAGNDALWRKFESDSLPRLLEGSPSRAQERQRNSLDKPSPVGELSSDTDLYGAVASVDGLRTIEPEDAFAIAKRLFEEANSSGEPALYEKAGWYFRKAGQREQENECRARLSEFRGNLEDAVSLWVQLSENTPRRESRAEFLGEALKTCWRGEMWHEYSQHAQRQILDPSPWRTTAAQVLSSKVGQDSEEIADLLEGLLDAISSAQASDNQKAFEKEALTSRSWQSVLDRVGSILILNRRFKDPERAERVLPTVEFLFGKSRSSLRAASGDLLFTCQREAEAGKRWAEFYNTKGKPKGLEPRRLRLAEALHVGLPEGLDRLKVSEDSEVIIRLCREHSERLRNDSWFDHYVRAMLETKRFDEVAREALQHRNFSKSNQIVRSQRRDAPLSAAMQELITESLKARDFKVLEAVRKRNSVRNPDSALMDYLEIVFEIWEKETKSDDRIDPFSDDEAREIRLCLQIYEGATYRSVGGFHPLFEGALWEMIGDFTKAFDTYNDLVTSPVEDKSVKQEATRRLLDVTLRASKLAVQRDNREETEKWRGRRNSLSEPRHKGYKDVMSEFKKLKWSGKSNKSLDELTTKDDFNDIKLSRTSFHRDCGPPVIERRRNVRRIPDISFEELKSKDGLIDRVRLFDGRRTLAIIDFTRDDVYVEGLGPVLPTKDSRFEFPLQLENHTFDCLLIIDRSRQEPRATLTYENSSPDQREGNKSKSWAVSRLANRFQ